MFGLFRKKPIVDYHLAKLNADMDAILEEMRRDRIDADQIEYARNFIEGNFKEGRITSEQREEMCGRTLEYFKEKRIPRWMYEREGDKV